MVILTYKDRIKPTDKIISCWTCKWSNQGKCKYTSLHPSGGPHVCFDHGKTPNYFGWHRKYKRNKYSLWEPKFPILDDNLFEI
jgi:hypothetical protein